MKIKTDFVTNSSSTSYVVFIPDGFYADEIEISKLYEKLKGYREATEEELYKELPECIETIKEGDNIWYYGGDGVNATVYDIILEICSAHGFILSEMDMNGEGNNTIKGVPEETIENILANNIDIMSTFKQIRGRGTDVTTKTEQK